ncbi:Ig-like domain-containing protein [Corallococcus macrosporus]|uniref:Ig-like domain-containing protein n=1 Tax=Corallococcus macrosporus TaxID=35 RepID=UPI0002FE5692|nr:Ig-like domain-containing protein [Corallococcus macrosporus]
MRYPNILAVSVIPFFWACINVPEVDVVPETPDAGPVTDAGPPTPAVTLELSRTVTNRDVVVRASVSGDVPDAIELFVDGNSVALLPPPRYELRWSMEALDEGTHSFAVRVTFGDLRIMSDASTLTVDRKAPRLVSQAPLPGAQTALVRHPIQAVFSEPIEPASVTTDSVKLWSNGSEVPVELLLSPERTSLTLRPLGAVPVDTVMSVTLTESVTDVAGNALAAPVTPWEWTFPAYLSMGGSLAADPAEYSYVYSPSLGFNATGDPIVAFIDGARPGNWGVHVKRWNGALWEPLGEVLDANDGETFVHAYMLQTSPEGDPVVAWAEGTEAGYTNVHVRRWAGSQWAAVGGPVETRLSQGFIEMFQFKVNTRGDMAMAFREKNLNQESQVSVLTWRGSAWEPLGEALKVDPTWDVSNVELFLDVLGRPTVVWSESNPGLSASKTHIQKWNGGAWESLVTPIDGSHRIYSLDGDDNLVWVITYAEFQGARASGVLRFDGTQGWVRLGGFAGGLFQGDTDALIGELGVDTQGRLVALLGEPEIADGPWVTYLRRWDGVAWGPLGGLLRPLPGRVPSGHGVVALDTQDQPVLARVEAPEGNPGLRYLYVYRANY